MTTLPLLESAVLLPFLGALALAAAKVRLGGPAFHRNLGFCVLGASFALALAAVCRPGAGVLCPLFAAEPWAEPVLVALPIVHLLVLAGTPKLRLTRAFVARVLVLASLTSLALVCAHPWLMVGALVLCAFVPAWDLKERGSPLRGYALHMALFSGLLVAGLLVRESRPALGAALILAGLLVRGGIFPFHGWVATLFDKGSVALALLFMLPLVEGAAVLRLLLKGVPAETMQTGAILCLVTAVYGGAMAIFQKPSRRFFAYLVLSQTAMALFGFLLASPVGMAAALALWVSNAIALSGMAFALRAVEARFGDLPLDRHHGHYGQVPRLAVCFLVSGLASVGFPGTVNFAPMELLLGGASDFGLWASVLLAVASMLGAVAILRAYFSIFTGKRNPETVSLRARPMELMGLTLIILAVLAGFIAAPAFVDSRMRAAEACLGTADGHAPAHP